MAVLQSNYAAQIPSMVPGQVLNGETSNRISRTVEDAAGIPFGKFVFDGAGDHGCTATPTAGKLLGMTIANQASTNMTFGSNTDAGYAQNATAGILTLGQGAVVAGANVTRRDQVYVTSAGAITNVASGNTIAPGWTFDATAAAGANVPVVRR